MYIPKINLYKTRGALHSFEKGTIIDTSTQCDPNARVYHKPVLFLVRVYLVSYVRLCWILLHNTSSEIQFNLTFLFCINLKTFSWNNYICSNYRFNLDFTDVLNQNQFLHQQLTRTLILIHLKDKIRERERERERKKKIKEYH